MANITRITKRSEGNMSMTMTDEQLAIFCDEYCRFPREVKDDETLAIICSSCPMEGGENETDQPG